MLPAARREGFISSESILTFRFISLTIALAEKRLLLNIKWIDSLEVSLFIHACIQLNA